MHKKKQKKITLWVPIDLLEAALKSGNRNITSTVQDGLKLIAAGKSYDKLLSLKGKVRLGIDLEELRRDR